LLLKIAKKLSKDFGISVTDETLSYILDHIRRDVPSLSATLRMLDKIAMQKQKSITIPFVRNYICTEKDEEFR
jgi:DnaA family protein